MVATPAPETKAKVVISGKSLHNILLDNVQISIISSATINGVAHCNVRHLEQRIYMQLYYCLFSLFSLAG